MATYIPGVTDYIPQVQPFQPDLNFYANVMQTKQGKYDAAKKQLSKLYGTLLYSPLTRDQNVKRRDEFFKVIDEDIKKISGMDLSLQQNVDQAMNVFNGFYNDKYMVQDMVWTKQFNNAVQKHEALKSCYDPKKCGGIAWDEGLQELQYKRDEFRAISDDESMNFSMPTYTPYYEWKKDALKAAADMGYNVVQDSFSKNGDYIITDKNGDLVKGGLYTIFKEAYGSDPRVEANYNTMAYVKRNNAARADASLYGSVEEAERQYISNIINQGIKNISAQLSKTNKDYDTTAARIADLEKKQLNKGLTPDEQQVLANAKAQKVALEETHNYLHKNLNAITANAESGDIQTLRRRADASTAQVLLESDLNSLAVAMSLKGKEQTIKVNPLAEIKHQHQANIALATHNHNLDMIKLERDADLKLNHDMIIAGMKQNIIPQTNQPIADIKEGQAGTNVQLDLKESPTAAYDYAKSAYEQPLQDAKSGSLDFLYSAFVNAKGAAKDSPGARDWLERTIGKNWKEVSDRDSFNKAFEGRSVNVLYHQTLNLLKDGKTGDIGWGENLIQQQAALINKIHMKSEAANAVLTKNLSENLKIANAMKATAATNPLYKYADDLFIKSNGKPSGFLDVYSETPSKSFAMNYLKDHPYDDMGDVEDAWDLLKKDYLERYNRDARPVGTGVGLSGQGNISANTYTARNVDPSNRTPDGTHADVVSTLNQALNSGAYTAVLGPNTKDALDNASPEMQDYLSGVLTQLTNEISKPWKPNDDNRPFYSVEGSAIGGGKKDQGALTIYPSADYIQKHTGEGKLFSKEMAPEILTNGITMFFDKKAVRSPFVEKANFSDFQTSLQYSGHVNVDAYQNTAGSLKATYNDLNGQVNFSVELKKVSPEGKLVHYKTITPPAYNLNGSDSFYKEALATLEAYQAKNLKDLETVREINRLKAQQQP